MLDDLSQLDDDTLIDYKARIALEIDRRRSGQPDRERSHHQSMSQVLRTAGIALLPWGAFTKGGAYPTFKKSSYEVARFVDEHIKPETEIDRLAIDQLLVKMALRYMTSRRVPLKVTPIIQQWGQPAKIVDVELPGYLSSGLLRPALLRKALS